MEGYERSRVGGVFERLLENLMLLKKSKLKHRSPTITNLRLMLRPSDGPRERQLRSFWRDYADTVKPQCVLARKDSPYREDVYMPVQFGSLSTPKCAAPFKGMAVKWNGDIPLCCESEHQIGYPGLIVGSVLTDRLEDVWNGDIMRRYRDGHRSRETDKTPVCKGCSGI